jgi:hypothetical protein
MEAEEWKTQTNAPERFCVFDRGRESRFTEEFVKIQVNSDNTIVVDAGLTRFVEDEGSRALRRFAGRLTRAEFHLSDVSNKIGHHDKLCLLEVRPMGARPRTASARATDVQAAVAGALGKMRRSLTTFFGRQGRPATAVQARAAAGEQSVAVTPVADASQSPSGRKQTKLSPRGPKKKWIYQARRKSWPTK